MLLFLQHAIIVFIKFLANSHWQLLFDVFGQPQSVYTVMKHSTYAASFSVIFTFFREPEEFVFYLYYNLMVVIKISVMYKIHHPTPTNMSESTWIEL